MEFECNYAVILNMSKWLFCKTWGWFPFQLGALAADASLSRRAELPGGVRWAAALRCRVSGQQDVGHGCVITGCDAFSLRSSIADPRGVAQFPHQSTTYLECIFWRGTL